MAPADHQHAFSHEIISIIRENSGVTPPQLLEYFDKNGIKVCLHVLLPLLLPVLTTSVANYRLIGSSESFSNILCEKEEVGDAS